MTKLKAAQKDTPTYFIRVSCRVKGLLKSNLTNATKEQAIKEGDKLWIQAVDPFRIKIFDQDMTHISLDEIRKLSNIIK